MMSSQKVLHVAGWESCGFYSRCLTVLKSLSILFPTRLRVIQHAFPDRTAYRAWLLEDGFRSHFTDPQALQHTSSPFVWFGTSEDATHPPSADSIQSYLGGHDATLHWCRQFMGPCEVVEAGEIQMINDGHTPDHGYDYDLVVIGGGSGGMAAAKEAAALGARVACLDFVKPSPAGTTWGLGGTCVNVGCIPKKLFHAGSLLNEAILQDSPAFGVQIASEMQANEISTQVQWPVLRENIQNYIRSLNFKYRVRLREKEVTYLNKLGSFQDAHTLEAVDKKGRSSTITSSRFLIATGGRPAPLSCPGGDLAISSDDIFFMEHSPGKTLCVGASYISLECAGFLAGIGLDVTVAVRSILLRGFDRECSDRVGKYMEEHSKVKFRRGVVPTKLQKMENGQIEVTFSDGSSEAYDTVLAAVGRTADTEKLGIAQLGIKVNPNNQRILGKYEQTDCPNVYAVGDVLDDTPELTPVAIQAGIKLARRLFGGAKESMDYANICTTVFTPIEYSCVGLSEDDAISKFGEDNIEVYHSEFLPLEWSMSNARSHSSAFAKIVCEKAEPQRVLGIHYVGPNAGEVMQGYGVSMRQGVTYKQLTETVGIHPTCSEEIVTLSVTKSSGEDAAAGGC